VEERERKRERGGRSADISDEEEAQRE